MIAFSTASSEAAYPKTLEGLNRFGASPRISAFVLPLGYSFNLDGTMMYCTFASIFIAQTYHIEMSIGTQLAMLATLMITSKGVAGVPRASLVVIAATLSQFNIPEAGLLMIMGIDTFLDMGRSATNVIGNSLATAWSPSGRASSHPSTRCSSTMPCRRTRSPAIRCAPDPRAFGIPCMAFAVLYRLPAGGGARRAEGDLVFAPPAIAILRDPSSLSARRATSPCGGGNRPRQGPYEIALLSLRGAAR